MFKPYLHVERFGNEEVTNIELGTTHVFPKLDGTNASVWYDPNDPQALEGLCAGSRTRQLSITNDNAGFFQACIEQPLKDRLLAYFRDYPNNRLYGEWLVPHTLKTYRESAWKRFWIFDVFNDWSDQYIDYNTYAPYLSASSLDYIPPLAIITNGSYDNFIHVLESNNFFIEEGKGLGEGIVIKNYDFYNKFDRQAQAKIVRSEFKEEHYRVMGAPERESKMVEEEIAEEFCTQAMCEKVLAKISNEMEGWTSKYIPRLLETVFYDLIKEETWEFLKKHKYPTINFGALRHLIYRRVKVNLPTIF
ncbi:MAG: RNA ligase family protein [Nitrosotalea sp.]